MIFAETKARQCFARVSNRLATAVLPRYRPHSSTQKLTNTSLPPGTNSRALASRISVQSESACLRYPALSASVAPTTVRRGTTCPKPGACARPLTCLSLRRRSRRFRSRPIDSAPAANQRGHGTCGCSCCGDPPASVTATMPNGRTADLSVRRSTGSGFSAGRPVSRVLFRTLRSGDGHFSRPTVARRLERPTRGS